MWPRMLALLLALPVLAALTPALAAPVWSVEAGVTGYQFDFREQIAPPVKSNEHGIMRGSRLIVERQQPDTWQYARLRVGYTHDDTAFRGTDQQGTPLPARDGQTMASFEGNLGRGIAKPARHLTLYSGVGGTYWKRRLTGGTGYSEEYRWVYLPVGVRQEYRINTRWSGAVDVAAQVMISGRARVNLSEADPRYSNPRVTLGNRIGVRAEAPVRYRLASRLALSVTPWYQQTAFGASQGANVLINGMPSALYVRVPASRTEQYGVDTGLRVEF